MKTLNPEEVFEYLKPEYKYIAKDGNGKWWAYYDKPSIENFWWQNENKNDFCLNDNEYFEIDIEYTGDWKDSLFERPKPLDERDELIKRQKEEISRLCDRIIRNENTISDLQKQQSVLKFMAYYPNKN